MLEAERTFEVGAHFCLPDLADCVPQGGRLIVRPPLRQRVTYYDTSDLRLSRSGASLRLCRGEDEPWTATLPIAASGRDRIRVPGVVAAIPQRLLDLVTAYTRGAETVPVITLNTLRRTFQLCDRDDRVALELIDDLISVNDGRRVALRFRRIELQCRPGETALLDQVEAVLRGAGAITGETAPAHIRALGLAAAQPSDWPPPSSPGSDASAADVVTAAIRDGVARIVTHDPLVRLRAPAGPRGSAVHVMWAGSRRLHSDLATFGPLLVPEWAAHLREELSWLADALTAAHDTEVLRARLRRMAEADPRIPLDQAAVIRMDADLAARLEDGLHVVEKALCEQRYHRFLDALLAASTEPRLERAAHAPAAEVLPTLPRPAWRRFIAGGDAIAGARHVTAESPDSTWQHVHAHGHLAGAAVAAVAVVLGGDAQALASALAPVLDLLDEQHQAGIASDTWLAIANADPDDHALAVTAGRLYERERAALRTARDAFPSAWRAASRRRLTQWLA